MRMRLRIGPADHLVDRLDQLLRAEHFGGVQSSVDPDDGLPFRGERARLIVGQPFGVGELRDDFLDSGRASRRFSGAVMIAMYIGRPSAVVPISHELHSVGFAVELLPVFDELRVVGEEIVVADVVPELLLRGRDSGLCGGGDSEQ